jgi:hypothetical protein
VLAHPMHAAERCGGSARHCFAGSSSGREETGYRFSPAPGRPIHRRGPAWSANAGGAGTPHDAFDDSGYGWYAQMWRCRVCGQESFKIWPVG